jgi:signal transduction histidine kinase
MFLSTLPARNADRRLALGVALASAGVFLATAPFATLPLAPVPAFIPVYESWLVICDLITAALLFSQFAIVRERSLYVLACGYLFTAFAAAAHALTFPGLFSPTGLLGAGTQSTAWLYMFWHAGFPLLVVAYAQLKDPKREPGETAGSRQRTGIIALGGIAGVALAVCGLTLLATAGADTLPAIMQGNRYTPAMIAVVSSVWFLSLVALLVLWRRRPHSLLDLWLMVVMCAWIFDIALSAVLNAGRFDLGFYAGRIYGLLAASFVLAVLLLENGRLYAGIVDAHNKHVRRLTMLHEIDLAVAGERSTEAIAGAAIRALRELLDVPRAIVNLFDLAAGEVEWLAAAGRRRTHVGPGVRYSIRLMGDVEALKRGEPQVIDTSELPPGPEVEALLASGVRVYMAMPMIAGGELIGAISFGGERQPFRAEQVSIAREVATQLAIAVRQARLYERVKGQAEDLEVRVRERTSELQAANKELDSFAYSVSHDLRAPLRALDGYTRILEEDHAAHLNAEARRLFEVVRASSQKMTQLIDALLDFSRLGRAPLKTQPVPLNGLVSQVVEELRSACAGRRIEFVLGDLGTAEADPVLLKQVLANLVGNAVKYSRGKDPARVEIGRSAEPGKGAFWYVKDNGAGFDMSYYGKLFGVFQRLHRADEFEGTGVGLAIVQRVIARHGGLVWAESKPGQGATFCFTLGAGRSSAASV